MLLEVYRKIYFLKLASMAKDLQTSTQVRLHEGDDFSSSVAHVIMPGASCLDTALAIPDGDVVIGFNFSALLPIKYDYIFIENANDSDYSDIQYAACLYHSNNGAVTLIKNIWMPDRFSMHRLASYSSFGKLVLDIPLRPRVIAVRPIIRRWLLNKSYAYSSFLSSTFFALNYLYCSGCKEVVLHGVDFGGPYFWELTNDICVDAERVAAYKSRPTHATELGATPFSRLIVELADELRAQGVTLRAANESGVLGCLL
ncbi:Uncharacterised protein [Stutzerimonas stutzeri]|uniref:hypothetical protein n=1 Tax=Stutzerimonas stutzeri subgroup TaxID=578833 RepID=UPI000F7089F7|nr:MULTISPECIES: hypothetical protein [Stutzerimonas stutzeri subgroup]MCQ2047195.1 hypothetical protein [Stutzerimonas kunmingensis]QQC10085.1 hypothetical protein I6I22_14670 [Stutzerimonas stutzeri]VEI33865.1 Uncharacterised protein [Stutzerimonas stutzeri]